MPTPPISRHGVPILERQLIYGSTKAGKSQKVLDYVTWFVKRKQEPTFYWISSDRGLQPFWTPDSGYEECEDLVVELAVTPASWEPWVLAMEEVKKGIAKNPLLKDMEPSEVPWLVVDLAHDAWTAAQNAHVDRIAGKSLTDYWLEQGKRAQGEKSGWALFEDLNYTVINRIYAELADLIVNFPGHVVVLTGEKPIGKDRQGNIVNETPENATLFGKVGYKPEGQKGLAHQLRTIIRAQAPQRDGGPHTWRQVADLPARQRRGQEEKWGGEVKNVPGAFFLEYMVKGGWRP